MIYNVLLLFALLLANPVLASPQCFEGEWELDVRNSDNQQRIKDKLIRKEKMDQRSRYRADNKQEEKPLFSAGVPAFLFFSDPLVIDFKDDNIILKQQSYKRRVNTKGKSLSISLKDLNNQGGSIIAGWEGTSLIIETTTVEGERINEQYQLLDKNTLHVQVQINTGASRLIAMEKLYLRHSRLADSCTFFE